MSKINVQRALARAETHIRKGDVDSARALYAAVLEAFPKNVRAKNRLADLDAGKKDGQPRIPLSQEQVDRLVALYNEGRFDQLIEQADLLVVEYPTSPLLWNILAAGRQALGQLAEAISAYQRAIELQPAYADAYNNMGNALKDQGKLDAAISAYRRALEIKPAYADAYYNMGNALKAQGKLDEEIAAYRQALAINPRNAEALNNTGNALKDQGKLVEAISAYRRAVEIKPTYADAFFNMGIALNQQGKLEEAMAAYRRSLDIRPIFADAYYNIGIVLKAQDKLEEAISAYKRAIDIRPAYSEAYFNLGNALNEQGRNEDSIIAFQRALEIQPTYAEAYNNLGNRLKDRGKLAEAISAYRNALEFKPAYAEAYNNMGNALKDQGKLDEAIASYRRAIEIKPTYAAAEAHLLFQCQHTCEWDGHEWLKEISARLGIQTDAVPPFALLSANDNPAEQLERAKTYALEQYKLQPKPLPAKAATKPERIKVGYFSADFHNHATMYLMAGLLREHDRSQFEVFAYSYGPDKSGDLRRQAESGVDHFFDIADLADRQVVAMGRSHGLDIAIDLKGYTQNTRTEIFQHRLAPIQINYLGYPGSLGADFFDYIIADPVVITDEQRTYCSENVIYLPHSYQPNDNMRPISATVTTRADFGLPEEAFVFCCFNNNYKIGPQEFDIWMRILKRIDNSVLWLLRSNSWAESNLRKEAQKRGVEPSRIVFAEKLPHPEHLARHKHADLFIDTFNYNAHTTASDALWGGLPVVTKKGRQFSACVAASLLAAIGLPELITNSDEEYEKLIVDIALDRDKYLKINQNLGVNRAKEPLFDTKRYAKNFERGLRQAYEKFWEASSHEDIWVRDGDS
ncbi:tetratricopeptide repeat protein [Novosphingobium sp. AAP83]|uniref:tetratricopeptide repeat protein n=1 Tax=Novosphingobium sp. AAP83 TaxID=1523425 RepID=UPI0006B8B7A2|nr:tetratricopeptide repeat protein [Novosphingobium sp. AAP83]